MERKLTKIELINKFNGMAPFLSEAIQKSQAILNHNVQAAHYILESEKYNDDLDESTKLIFTDVFYKLNSLPNIPKTLISEKSEIYITNLDSHKTYLHDVRKFIFNEKDDTYFVKLICRIERIFSHADGDIVLTALDENDKDISKDYVQFLKRIRKSISSLVDRKEFNILYNGYLAHASQPYLETITKLEKENEILDLIYKCTWLAVEAIRLLCIALVSFATIIGISVNNYLLYPEYTR